MARRENGYFSSKDAVRLYWESTYPNTAPIAHVALVHGYADHSGRYHSTADALASRGMAVHAFDYRGHGQAEGRRGHVVHWGEYLQDLDQFWKRVLEQASSTPCFLMGHSHGGLMAVHYLAKNPKIRGAILSAPYLGLAIKPNPLQVLAAKAIGRFIPVLPQRLPIPPSELTRDVIEQAKVSKDPLYNRWLTVGWFLESQKAQAQALALGPELRMPIFVFCGEKDGVASTAVSHDFFQTVASSDKTWKQYTGMLHEPLNEVGREQVWHDIVEWIQKRLS